MGAYNDFLNKGINYKQGSSPEYYEDTHDRNGNYRAFKPEIAPPFVSDRNSYLMPQQGTTLQKGYVIQPNISPQYSAQILNSNLLQPSPSAHIPQYAVPNVTYQPALTQSTISQPAGVPLPSSSAAVSPRNYQNLVVYHPTTPEDVEMLIDYLRRKEPAIINLDSVDEYRAQRVLDFVSGAIFALNGSIQRVSSNIFLICPEGVQIITPI